MSETETHLPGGLAYLHAGLGPIEKGPETRRQRELLEQELARSSEELYTTIGERAARDELASTFFGNYDGQEI